MCLFLLEASSTQNTNNFKKVCFVVTCHFPLFFFNANYQFHLKIVVFTLKHKVDGKKEVKLNSEFFKSSD
jgi:hypothetical protein